MRGLTITLCTILLQTPGWTPTCSSSITINTNLVTVVESVKYLGVTITSDLKWNTHITNTCKSAKQRLGLLYRNFQLADQKTLSQLYKALVLPKLDYCSYHPHNWISKNSIRKVMVLSLILQYVNREMKIKAKNGKEYYLVDVIAQILKYLKIELIENHLKSGGYALEATDFDWVITVPVIWRARARQMMREAGYKVILARCMFPFHIM